MASWRTSERTLYQHPVCDGRCVLPPHNRPFVIRLTRVPITLGPPLDHSSSEVLCDRPRRSFMAGKLELLRDDHKKQLEDPGAHPDMVH